MINAFEYDLVVIGSGPAGEKGAAKAAYFGKKVAVVERAAFVGGAGINTGTVPSKTLRETALYFSGLRQRGLYGIDYSLRDDLNISAFMYGEKHVVESERSIIQHNLERHKIETIWGEASLYDPHTVHVTLHNGAERLLTAAVILIATGSSGDVFVAAPAKARELREELKADAVDMESAAVAQVCSVLGVPWLVIRSMSDSADANAVRDAGLFYSIAAENSLRLVTALVSLLSSPKI